MFTLLAKWRCFYYRMQNALTFVQYYLSKNQPLHCARSERHESFSAISDTAVPTATLRYLLTRHPQQAFWFYLAASVYFLSTSAFIYILGNHYQISSSQLTFLGEPLWLTFSIFFGTFSLLLLLLSLTCSIIALWHLRARVQKCPHLVRSLRLQDCPDLLKLSQSNHHVAHYLQIALHERKVLLQWDAQIMYAIAQHHPIIQKVPDLNHSFDALHWRSDV